MKRNRQPGSGKAQKASVQGTCFLFVQEINKSFIRPHKMCIPRLKAVNQNILSRAEPVRHGHKIRPVRCFLDGHPPFQRRQLHDLIPELLVFCDRQIQLGQYAAEIKAVARSAIRCNAECHVFRVGEHTALACGVFRKFSSGMAAGRADHEDGADGVMNSVRLRDCDGSL